jgi:collagenase-like PrtC family protease
LLDKINTLNKKYGSIRKVYGSLPTSVIGHGRVSGLVRQFGDPNMDNIKEFIEKAHRLGLEVNYLANALCLGEMGYTDDGRMKISCYLDEVYDSGADIVTVASPYIHRLIKSEYPSLKTEISVYAEIDTVQKFRRWEELGADIINLPARVNRDLNLLSCVSRSRQAEVELLVNESCLFHCPYMGYHHTISSHRSRGFDEGLDYCMLECVKDRLKDRSELLRSPWIRPEDIAYYEKNYGIDRFKIQGRQMPLEWILATVEAYSSRRYHGNLLDLISPTYPNWSARAVERRILNECEVENIRKPDIYIDNGQLGEFFNTIVKKGGCAPTQLCDICGHCFRTAEKLVKIRDSKGFEEYAAATNRLLAKTVAPPQSGLI